MAAMVCPACEVCYPYPFAAPCQWCGSRLEYSSDDDPHADWMRNPAMAMQVVEKEFARLLTRHAEFAAWCVEHETED